MASRKKPQGCCVPARVAPLPAKKLERASAVARALADKNRMEIMHFLSQQDGPVCACDVRTRADLSQPTVSHHLKILREAGLLQYEKRGLWAFYEPHPDAREALATLLDLAASR